MSIMEDACEHTSTGRGRGKKSPLTKVNSWNELHRCIIAEDVERVEELLEGGANPNEPTVSRGNTPLHLACMEGLEDLVETLLQHGADPDSQNVDGESPLHFAVRSGNQSIIEKLLEEDPCLDVVDHENLTPLHWAVLEDDAEMVRTLLRYGADPLVETFTDGNAAFLAVSHDCLSALSVLLSYAPTLLLDVDYEGNSLLHIAVSCGHEAIVECLLAEGIDVSILNDDDATAADLTTSDSILKLIQAYSSPSSSSSSSSSSCSSSSPSSPTASPTMRMPSLPLSSENFHGSLSLPSLSPPLSSRS